MGYGVKELEVGMQLAGKLKVVKFVKHSSKSSPAEGRSGFI